MQFDWKVDENSEYATAPAEIVGRKVGIDNGAPGLKGNKCLRNG